MVLIFFFLIHRSIGQRFAMMLARVALVLLLKNFEFSLDSKTTVPLQMNKQSILFTPQDDVYLKKFFSLLELQRFEICKKGMVLNKN